MNVSNIVDVAVPCRRCCQPVQLRCSVPTAERIHRGSQEILCPSCWEARASECCQGLVLVEPEDDDWTEDTRVTIVE